MKKSIVAIVVALLTMAGVVLPEPWVDKFVTLFVSSAYSNSFNNTSPRVASWAYYPHTFHCDWYCSCPKEKTILVEALRPSSVHSSTDRSPIHGRS